MRWISTKCYFSRYVQLNHTFYEQNIPIEIHLSSVQEEYEDKEPPKEEKPISTEVPKQDASLAESSEKLIDTNAPPSTSDDFQSNLDDLLGICDNVESESSASDPLLNLFDNPSDLLTNSSDSKSKPSAALSNFSFDLFGKSNKPAVAQAAKTTDKSASKPSKSDKKATAWFDLFADLDPFANPAAMEQKLAGANKNYLDA